MDEKEEDKSLESFQKHLIFYKKLNKKISDMEEEIKNSKDEKIISHLQERIKAINLDKTRIQKLFPEKDIKIWMDES